MLKRHISGLNEDQPGLEFVPALRVRSSLQLVCRFFEKAEQLNRMIAVLVVVSLGK